MAYYTDTVPRGEGLGWYETAQVVCDLAARARSSASTFVRTARKELTMWRQHFIIGNPHQELVPWCGWLRPVQNRHLDWQIAWPGEDHLHP